MRPQPTTIGLPPSFCHSPLLFPMWSSLALEPRRGRKCLDPSLASCSSIAKSLPKAQESTIRILALPFFAHGMSTSYHWKLPLSPTLVTEQHERCCVQRCCDWDDAKAVLLPLLEDWGRSSHGSPSCYVCVLGLITFPLWAQDRHP